MRPISEFATEEYPLHPSALGALLTCPWRIAMNHLYDPTDEGGVAGDTGSACHVAVANYHMGKELAACIEAMGVNIHKFPRADLNDAAHMFLKYSQDTRNQEAKVLYVEEPIAFTISPAEEDPTQAPIKVIGTVDQVREINGVAYVLDVKTSKKDPATILSKSVFQVAAYCVGMSVKLNRVVQPGPLILPRKYGRNPSTDNVFWHFPWKFDDIPQILLGVRHTVAAIRAGKIWHIPNEDCTWCTFKSPDFCLPRLQELRRTWA